MAEIYYHDIGDYLSREEKLKRIRANRSALGGMEWVTIIPNEKNDWINQRDGVFDSLIAIMPDKKQSVFSKNIVGLTTARDSWDYNSSKDVLSANILRLISFYNEQVSAYHSIAKGPKILSVEDFIEKDESKISWTRYLRRQVSLNRNLFFDNSQICVGMHRPFFKQNLYYSRDLVESPGIYSSCFPNKLSTPQICVSTSSSKDFCCLMSDCPTDYDLVNHAQCFPLYYYEENKNKQKSLFDEESNDDYIRRDGITDWILKEVRTRYGTKNITKEMIFYYVYGLLHSKDYRERFAADLKKSLPRIPIVDSVEDFMEFYKAGKELADLHLNYETVAPYPDVIVHGDRQVPLTVKRDPATGGYIQAPADDGAYDYFRVIDKMRFRSKDDKSVIIYNGNITIENIPQKAYDYIVNGKSAIEWIVERYAVTQDKKSLIKNDANDWAREHHKPRYILDLLLSVINVSVQTVDIVNSLPKLKFD